MAKLVQVFSYNTGKREEIVKIQAQSPSRARKIAKLMPDIPKDVELKYIGFTVEGDVLCKL